MPKKSQVLWYGVKEWMWSMRYMVLFSIVLFMILLVGTVVVFEQNAGAYQCECEQLGGEARLYSCADMWNTTSGMCNGCSEACYIGGKVAFRIYADMPCLADSLLSYNQYAEINNITGSCTLLG